MRLFISHASEDKADFVEPLVRALRESYDVWYDVDELRIGDSLFRRINAGLNSADFGVVVLSPYYFAKEWPQAELDGLVALETATRKVILPVWRNVDKADVARFSPILAGRLAIKADEGVPKVVEAIRLAVDASDRQRQLTILDSATRRLKGIDETLTERRNSTAVLGSVEGASRVVEAAGSLFAAVRSSLSAVAEDSGILKFEFRKGDAVTMSVKGPFLLNLHATVRSLAGNSAATARLVVSVFREVERETRTDFEIICKREFTPFINRTNEVVWVEVGDDERRPLKADEVAAQAIALFCTEIERVGLKD